MIHWAYKHFNDLTVSELYAIIALRNIVFVVEQNCVYNDTDDKDLDCWHLCGYYENELVAYARIIRPGVSYPQASIGRVVTHPDFRKKGFGIELMKLAIEKTRSEFNINAIKISAQSYLINFYQSLGFGIISETYLEDGIPHVAMLYQ